MSDPTDEELAQATRQVEEILSAGAVSAVESLRDAIIGQRNILVWQTPRIVQLMNDFIDQIDPDCKYRENGWMQ